MIAAQCAVPQHHQTFKEEWCNPYRWDRFTLQLYKLIRAMEAEKKDNNLWRHNIYFQPLCPD